MMGHQNISFLESGSSAPIGHTINILGTISTLTLCRKHADAQMMAISGKFKQIIKNLVKLLKNCLCFYIISNVINYDFSLARVSLNMDTLCYLN